MDTQVEAEVLAPEAAKEVPKTHENTLKAVRFATKFADAQTEAVIIISKKGSFAMMDMQKPGAYQLTPSNPINERWRETLRKGFTIAIPPATKALVVTPETVYPPKQATPALAAPPAFEVSKAVPPPSVPPKKLGRPPRKPAPAAA